MLKSIQIGASFLIALTTFTISSCQSNTVTLPIYGQREMVRRLLIPYTIPSPLSNF